jgi:hypothetical protein
MRRREPFSAATLPSSSTMPVNTPFETTYIDACAVGGFGGAAP